MYASRPEAAVLAAADETAAAAEIVERFLVASMVPDPETAARYIAETLKITFTGGRKFAHPRESTAFNARRYKWVKKKMERTDVVPGHRRDHRLQSRHAVRRMAGRHAVRGQPLCRPLRGARRQDRADGCLERQRRAAADAAWDCGVARRGANSALILRNRASA